MSLNSQNTVDREGLVELLEVGENTDGVFEDFLKLLGVVSEVLHLSGKMVPLRSDGVTSHQSVGVAPGSQLRKILCTLLFLPTLLETNCSYTRTHTYVSTNGNWA